MPDQRGILRGYVKYDNEIRTGRNVKQLVHRALQIARSEPAGPVYLVGPREVMEEQVEPYTVDPARSSRRWRPPRSPLRRAGDRDRAGPAPPSAHRHVLPGPQPGRGAEAGGAGELLAIPVLESAAFHVNFPGDHPLHAGYQFTTSAQNPVLAEADVILVLDSDVPWIPATSRPSADAAIYASTSTRSRRACRCGMCPRGVSPPPTRRLAVEQITGFVRDNILIDAAVEVRRIVVMAASQARRAALDALEQPGTPMA